VLGQAGQRDTGRLVVVGHVEIAAIERRAAHRVGRDVDDGVGAGECIELDGRGGAECAFAWPAVTVSEIKGDSVTVDGDQRGAFDGLVTGEGWEVPPVQLRPGDDAARVVAGQLILADGNRTIASRVVLGRLADR